MTSRGPLYLLRPTFLSIRNRFRKPKKTFEGKAFPTLLVGGVIWLAMAAVATRLLRTFDAQPEIARLLAGKVLDVSLAGGLAIAVVAMSVAALGVLYDDRDLPLMLTAPVDWLALFGSQLARVAVYGGVPVLLVLSPVLWAAWTTQVGGGVYWGVVALGAPAFLATAAAVGTFIAILGVRYVGQRKARALFAFALLSAIAVAFIWVRTGLPGRVLTGGPVDPMMIAEALSEPTAPWLPSSWWAGALMASSRSVDLFALAAMLGAGLLTVAGCAGVYAKLYPGTGRTLEAGRVSGRSLAGRLFRASGRAPLLVRESARLLRDRSVWGHWLLLGVATLVYLSNLHLLRPAGPDSTGQMLVEVVTVLNLGVGALLVASAAVHSVFPQISVDGASLWVLRAGPVAMGDLVRAKLWVARAALLPVAVIIAVSGALVLRASLPLVGLSIVTSAVLAWAMASGAIWFGAQYARFDARSAAEVASSGGAAVFTLAALAVSAVTLFAVAPFAFRYLGSGAILERLPAYFAGPTWQMVGLAVAAHLFPLTLSWWATRRAPVALERALANL